MFQNFMLFKLTISVYWTKKVLHKYGLIIQYQCTKTMTDKMLVDVPIKDENIFQINRLCDVLYRHPNINTLPSLIFLLHTIQATPPNLWRESERVFFLSVPVS